ncbi:hypothetical protein [Chishuiella sp.]|uniref:hypothetical protein n=1 Tax=Chishuiella sp. TaxID=1969467 RepID=UPI0028ABE5C1|nr:hypothetical protein [Chishuiella sp.]
MKKSILLVGFLSSTLIFNSCGVIFGGSRYVGDIRVNNHPNAEIYANGEKIGTGEVTKSFKRSKDLKIEVKQDGCEPKSQVFENRFRTGNFILSVITFGIVGIAVDLGTGASYKPDHRNNDAIDKVSDKKYIFNVDYSQCK